MRANGTVHLRGRVEANPDGRVMVAKVRVTNSLFDERAEGTALCHPDDSPRPEIGARLALGRALIAAGQRLISPATGLVKHFDDVKAHKAKIQKEVEDRARFFSETVAETGYAAAKARQLEDAGGPPPMGDTHVPGKANGLKRGRKPTVVRMIMDAAGKQKFNSSSLAQRMGISTATAWRLLNGYGTPRGTTVKKVARVLGLDPKLVASLVDKAYTDSRRRKTRKANGG